MSGEVDVAGDAPVTVHRRVGAERTDFGFSISDFGLACRCEANPKSTIDNPQSVKRGGTAGAALSSPGGMRAFLFAGELARFFLAHHIL